MLTEMPLFYLWFFFCFFLAGLRIVGANSRVSFLSESAQLRVNGGWPDTVQKTLKLGPTGELNVEFLVF